MESIKLKEAGGFVPRVIGAENSMSGQNFLQKGCFQNKERGGSTKYARDFQCTRIKNGYTLVTLCKKIAFRQGRLKNVTYWYHWCLGPELNRHGGLPPRDFKSLASTNSATQALFSHWVIGSMGHCETWPSVIETINIGFGLFCQLRSHSVVFTLTHTLSRQGRGEKVAASCSTRAENTYLV